MREIIPKEREQIRDKQQRQKKAKNDNENHETFLEKVASLKICDVIRLLCEDWLRNVAIDGGRGSMFFTLRRTGFLT